MEIAQDNGWDVEGVEFSKDAFNLARKKRLKVHNCDFLEMHFPSNSFDVAPLWFAIDHFEFPNRVVEEVFRILNPGGLIAMDTFMVDNLLFTLLDFFYKSGIRYPVHRGYTLQHSHYFTTRTFVYLLELNGFKIVLQKGRRMNTKIVATYLTRKVVSLLNLLAGKRMEMLIIGRKECYAK